jgi:hypothetical protein
MSSPVDVILGLVKKCSEANERVKQNKKRCERLVESIKAIQPVLVDIEKQEIAMAHIETLEQLKRVIEEAHALLLRQFTKGSYFAQLCMSSSVAEQFADIKDRLAEHTRAMSISLGTHQNMALANLSVLISQNSGGPAPVEAPAEVATVIDTRTRDDDIRVLERMQYFVEDYMGWTPETQDFLKALWPKDLPPTKWWSVTFYDHAEYSSIHGELAAEHGVGRDRDGRVVELSLDMSNAQGTALALSHKKFVREIGNLTGLGVLVLSACRIQRVPKEFGQLTRLQHLYLVGNELTQLPVELFQLTSLELLDLSDNRLTTLPPEIGKLTNLMTLNLDVNKLTTLPPEIAELGVIELDISYNPITHLPAELGEEFIRNIVGMPDNVLLGDTASG